MSLVFLVTGCSRGLGRQIAEQALAAGHRLVATARDPRTLEDLSERYGERIYRERLDVTDYAACEMAVANGFAQFGRLDVVVNNAGLGEIAALEDADIDAFRRQIETNFLGTVYVSKAAVPRLREQGGGRIIQISSVVGRLGTAGLTAYQSSKWAIGGFSEALSAEVAPLGIRVTVLEPGTLRTGFSSTSPAPPPSPPYQATVGPVASYLGDLEHTANGDPKKLAQLLLKVARMDDPPLRLLAGSDGFTYGTQAWHYRLEVDAQLEEYSRSIDSDDADGSWKKRPRPASGAPA